LVTLFITRLYPYLCSAPDSLVSESSVRDLHQAIASSPQCCL